MIKLKIKYGNSQTDLRFPCTEKEMSAVLERIHAEVVYKTDSSTSMKSTSSESEWTVSSAMRNISFTKQ